MPFPARALVLKPLRALGLADVHPTILGFPLVDGRIADAVLAAQICDGNPGLVLFQNADDLIFGEPAALHLWSFRLGQSLPQTGLGGGGNVYGKAHRWETDKRHDGFPKTVCARSVVKALPGRFTDLKYPGVDWIYSDFCVVLPAEIGGQNVNI